MNPITDYDPADTSHQEVYAFLKQLREQKPVFFSKKHNGWIVSRYDDLVAAVNDPALTVENAIQGAQDGQYCRAALDVLATGVDWNRTLHVQSGEGADHARLRKALMSVINPKRIHEMRPVVQDIVDGLIDRFIERGNCEFVSEFAYRLAMLTVLNLIGFNEAEDDMSRFPVWIEDTFRLLLTPLDEEQQVIAATHAVQFQHYIREKIAARRANPRDDLLSEVLARLSSGEAQMTDDELVIMFTHSFVGAGHETTKLSITNGIYHLLEERSRWESLLANPERVSEFVEENLRYDAPLLAWYRYRARSAARRAPCPWQPIARGQKVIIMFGSANHDAAKYADAESFCPFRTEIARHLTFNTGKHVCIGAPLARLELNTALATLARRIPSLRLAPGHEVVYGPNFANRIISQLHLEWER